MVDLHSCYLCGWEVATFPNDENIEINYCYWHRKFIQNMDDRCNHWVHWEREYETRKVREAKQFG